MSRPTFAAMLIGVSLTMVAYGSTMATVVLAKDVLSADGELAKRLDCLINMPGPRVGIASKAFMPFLEETRTWLAGEEAQDTLLRELPKLTTRQLVTLWDVLWIAPAKGAAGSPRDMDVIAVGFSRKFNDAAINALADEKDAMRRRLLMNMVKPQAHTLTETQAAAFLKVGGWKED